MLTTLEKQSLQRACAKAKLLLRDFAPEVDEIRALWFHEPEEQSLRGTLVQEDLDREASLSEVTREELFHGLEGLIMVLSVIETYREELTQLSARAGG